MRKLPLYSTQELTFMGSEPDWSFTPVNDYHHEMGRGLNWYNYVCESKHNRQFLNEWVRVYRPHSETEDIEKLNTVPDKWFPTTIAHLARMQMRGFPLSEHHQQKITYWIETLAPYTKEPSTVKQTFKPKMEVLQREKGMIDEMVDKYWLNNTIPDFFTLFQTQDLKSSDKDALTVYLQQYWKEFTEVIEARQTKDATDEQKQLKEAYRNYTSRQINAFISSIETCLHSLRGAETAVATTKKTVRRKRKLDPQKMVRKLNFLSSDQTLNIHSIEPSTIIGADEVWVFDTKTRKMNVFYSDLPGSLTVKGTKIVGFRESVSLSKILRKPEEQLPVFKGLRKNQLNNWFTDIKAKGQPVKPRITNTMVLLRVVNGK